ncbi:MAG: hypothetical protein IJ679_11130, partial [Lachnospiraceae bacterium]|nr:hypothetical protein [Lachnospiraceae bacterium]
SGVPELRNVYPFRYEAWIPGELTGSLGCVVRGLCDGRGCLPGRSVPISDCGYVLFDRRTSGCGSLRQWTEDCSHFETRNAPTSTTDLSE